MAVRSMTGFARFSGEAEGFEAIWEIKSVNGRGLEARARVPAMLDGFDIAVRKRLGQRLSRGSVSAHLSLRAGEVANGLRVDEDKLSQLFAIARKLEGHPGVQPPRLDGLLTLPGVVDFAAAELGEGERERLEAQLFGQLDGAVDRLVEAREREGAELKRLMLAQIDRIDELVTAAEASEGARLETIRANIAERLEALLDKDRMDAGRLEQEAALMALKADVREEIDRLRAHVAEARSLLDKGGAIGRRLDFLAQEFNREANTLCSKSADTALTRIGLDLKAAIDQLKEQCQNVE